MKYTKLKKNICATVLSVIFNYCRNKYEENKSKKSRFVRLSKINKIKIVEMIPSFEISSPRYQRFSQFPRDILVTLVTMDETTSDIIRNSLE